MVRSVVIAVLLASVSPAAEQGHGASAIDFRGLTVGEATLQDVVASLGQPLWGNPAGGRKLIYESTRKGHTDSLRFRQTGRGKDAAALLSTVRASTPPAGLTHYKDVLARLGAPEYRLELPNQFMFEYCRHGVRLWFRRDTGETIGVAYFEKSEPRVAPGEPKLVDLGRAPSRKNGTAAIFRAGVASEVISPPDLSVLRERYKSIHDDLEARCLVLAMNGRKIAFLGADLFAFTDHGIAPIRKAAEEVGIDFLLFASSHTHSAPDTVGVYGHYPESYVQFIQRKSIECVIEAAHNLIPVTIEVGQRELPLDGARIEQVSYNARNPGIVDPFLTVVRLVTHEAGNASGETVATLVHFACHPERLSGYGRAISADYVTSLRKKVELELGGTCVFLNGPLGGMLTPDGIPGTDRFEDTERIGTWLGERATAIAQDGMSKITGSMFRFAVRPVEIPVTSPKLLQPMQEETLKGRLIQGRYLTEVARIDIGDMQIIGIPGELFPELGFAIREHMTGGVNIIVGLANDEIGYIIPAYDFRAGVYEESMSLGPSAGPQIVDAALELLKPP